MAARATAYALQAARVLGFVEESHDGFFATDSGRQLLVEVAGSRDEAALFRNAIQSCAPIQLAVGDLFEVGLTSDTVTQRIMVAAPDLSRSTAARRAASLMAWRRTIIANSTLATHPQQIELELSRPTAEQPAHVPTVPPREILSANELAYFTRQFARGNFLLFTGAGFSFDATDCDGNRLPVGAALAREIWSLCYGSETYEATSRLSDLFAVAYRTRRKDLDALLRRRLTVHPSSLPEHYRTWFSAPWRRVYTLNVDDLEIAASVHFDLPRSIRSLSAQRREADPIGLNLNPQDLAVIHLNGVIVDGIDLVTFSPNQYAERLSGPEPVFAHLASDFLAFPVVFVGSELDETTLWQHVELRGSRSAVGENELRPKSFLVSPSLSRARQALLEEFNVHWIRATAREFAEFVLEPAAEATQLGLAALGAIAVAGRDSAENVHPVSEIIARAPRAQTDYLLGAEPTWSDLLNNRAILREIDDELFQTAQALIRPSPSSPRRTSTPVLLVTGTAGSGKSTSLMRLAMRLSTGGHSVGWVGGSAEISPRELVRLANAPDRFDVICLDDANRYGQGLAKLISDVQSANVLGLLCLGLRSSQAIALQLVEIAGEHEAITMPYLSDRDVGRLLDVLSREHRLGALKGKSRRDQEKAFAEQAGRQLLVAMIEATSGQRFDEKVLSEWENLPVRARYYYSLITVATAFHYSVSRQELLLATSGSRSPGDLGAIEALRQKHIVSDAEGGSRLRSRHSVIAEKLLPELQSRGGVLTTCIKDLATAVASATFPEMPRSSREWRFLRAILNNRTLFRLLDLSGARDVYQAVEAHLHWDYHYLLQRGSLEVKEGDIRLAEQFLNQARSLNSSDHLVVTEHSYMRMRRAMTIAEMPEADRMFAEACETLRAQILARGRTDSYPFHVLGSQTIAWVKRCGAPQEEKIRLLKDALADVQRGVAEHPQARDLVSLSRDLQKEILQFAVRPGPS